MLQHSSLAHLVFRIQQEILRPFSQQGLPGFRKLPEPPMQMPRCAKFSKWALVRLTEARLPLLYTQRRAHAPISLALMPLH